MKLTNLKKMTEIERQQKILVLAGVLPAIADIIEDLNDDLFKRELKRAANTLYQEIRKNDEMILRETKVKLSDEQVLITRAFNLWIKKNFDVDEAQKIMIEIIQKEEDLEKKKQEELAKKQFIFNKDTSLIECKCGKNAVLWKENYVCKSIVTTPCKYTVDFFEGTIF